MWDFRSICTEACFLFQNNILFTFNGDKLEVEVDLLTQHRTCGAASAAPVAQFNTVNGQQRGVKKRVQTNTDNKEQCTKRLSVTFSKRQTRDEYFPYTRRHK